MPSLLLAPFPTLIQSIPVLDHSIQVKSALWQEKFATAGQAKLASTIFGDDPVVRITRRRLLQHAYDDQNQKCVEILLWGYPTDMRGVASNLLPESSLTRLVECAQSSDPWPIYWNNYDSIEGIGISTITKLAYFYQKSFDDNTALILDNTLIDATSRWDETALPRLSYSNAKQHYLTYLHTMKATALRLGCTGDQLELFLFSLGEVF